MSEIEGKLIVKEEVVNINDNFKKREFVIEVVNEKDEKFNDFLKFQLTQDKCAYLDKLNIGQTLKVSFNLKGRRWEKDGKVSYFITLEAWKVFGVEGGVDETFGKDPLGVESEDDLPF